MNTELKLSYKNQKKLKKLSGKLLGREIAFGRILVKVLKNKYKPKEGSG